LLHYKVTPCNLKQLTVFELYQELVFTSMQKKICHCSLWRTVYWQQWNKKSFWHGSWISLNWLLEGPTVRLGGSEKLWQKWICWLMKKTCILWATCSAFI